LFGKKLFKKIRLNLVGAKFDLLELTWKFIKEYHIDSLDDATNLAFIKNYKNIGWYDDADDCYYDYRFWSQSQKFKRSKNILSY
jgi:hypothetical protein